MGSILFRKGYQLSFNPLIFWSSCSKFIWRSTVCFQFPNISFLGSTTCSSKVWTSQNSHYDISLNGRWQIFISVQCLGHSRLHVWSLSRSQVLLILSVIVISISHILSQLSSQDQSLNLMFQLPTILNCITVVLVVYVILSMISP